MFYIIYQSPYNFKIIKQEITSLLESLVEIDGNTTVLFHKQN